MGALHAGQGGPQAHPARLQSLQLSPEIAGQLIVGLRDKLRGTVRAPGPLVFLHGTPESGDQDNWNITR